MSIPGFFKEVLANCPLGVGQFSTEFQTQYYHRVLQLAGIICLLLERVLKVGVFYAMFEVFWEHTYVCKCGFS